MLTGRANGTKTSGFCGSCLRNCVLSGSDCRQAIGRRESVFNESAPGLGWGLSSAHGFLVTHVNAASISTSLLCHLRKSLLSCEAIGSENMWPLYGNAVFSWDFVQGIWWPNQSPFSRTLAQQNFSFPSSLLSPKKKVTVANVSS